jgi:hypothetical protein
VSISRPGAFRHGESGFDWVKEKGTLWGRGEMSIESAPHAGEDDGIGGVVTPSQRTGVVAPSIISN